MAAPLSGSGEGGIFEEKDSSHAYWVRLTLDDATTLEGAVVKGRLHERPSPEGFVACRDADEEAGIRLWYAKGSIPWRFIPRNRVRSVFTLRSMDLKEWEALATSWQKSRDASKAAAESESMKARAELQEREKSYLELIQRKDEPAATSDAVPDTGHVIKGATLAVTLDSTGHNTFLVADPSSLSDPDLQAYFLGYRPEDKAKLIAKKNSSGSLAQLSEKDRQFLALYDRWFKLYGSDTLSSK